MAVALPALAGLCALPAPARAGLQDFIPTPYHNSLTLEAGVSYERDERGASAEEAQAESDLFARERLTFVTDGFSYHPRFIQYHLMLAADLKQETYESDTLGTVGANGAALNYDLQLNVLPEHPYRLNLFTSRTEPLYKQYFSADSGAVVTRSGAMFSYRKKPFILNLRYIDSASEWARGSSDLDIYSANGSYFKEFTGARTLSFTSFYNHSTSSFSASPGGSAENYGVGNTIGLNKSSLQSTLSNNEYRPDEETGDPDSGGFTWLERLQLHLPLHLTGLLTYRYQKRDQFVAADGTSGGEVRSANNRNFELELIHKLYQSLETTFRLRRDTADTLTGDTASMGNSIDFNYAKSVPTGMLLAGASFSRSETDSSGQMTVADEAHSRIRLNEVFTTQQREADCGSIAVFLIDHAAGNRPIQVEFVAVPSPGARCDIQVTGIPSDFDETVPHDYTISYVLETGNYTLRTDAYGYNASLTLLQNNLNPYVSRTVSDAKVVSGVYPGIPSDGAVSTVGLILGSLPWRLLGEYQQSDGSADAYRRWRGELDYNGSVTTTTNLVLAAGFTSTKYPEGSTAGSPQAYTDEETRFSADLQQRLFGRSVVLSAGGSYSSFQGLMNSSTYTLHANLQWRIGKTIVTAGANSYSSRRVDSPETDGVRAHQYYFLNVRREIF